MDISCSTANVEAQARQKGGSLFDVDWSALLGLRSLTDRREVFGKLAELRPLFFLKSLSFIASMPDAIQVGIDVPQLNSKILFLDTACRI